MKNVSLKRQIGSASTEWTILTLLVVAALFAPIAGDGQSTMGLIMETMQGFHKHGSKAYGLP